MSDLVMVVGNSRSGTTMMGRVLGKSAKVFTFGELHFFEQKWERCGRYNLEEAQELLAYLISVQRDGYFVASDLTSRKFLDEAANVLVGVGHSTLGSLAVYKIFLENETSLHHKGIACEQTPRNLFFLGEILEAFSACKIIMMVRDPRDILLSQKNKWKRRTKGLSSMPVKEVFRTWMNYHPFTIAKLWEASAAKIYLYEAKERTHLLKFEDLLQRPEECVEEVCQFLGIEYNEEMLAVPQVGSSTLNDKAGIFGINSSRTSAWKQGGLSKTEIWICEKFCARGMEKYGYQASGISPNLLKLAYYFIIWPIKITGSIVLNLGRTKNMVASIKRRILVN